VGILSDRSAIITGGASGIGKATAILFATEGSRVLIADLNLAGAEEVAAGIRSSGGEALACRTDVAEEPDVKAMVALAVDKFGGVDILHNNAGAVGPDVLGRDSDVISMDVDVWDKTMAVNVRGVMLGCKYAVPPMLERGRGSIVNASSVSALAGSGGRFAYGTSKGALISLTKYVATAYGQRGVRCNALAPGLIMTPATVRNLPPDQFAVYEQNVLAARLGQPEDIAQAVLFLASDASVYINGQTISVDGGMLAHQPYYAQFQAMTRSG
jgi:NAD(P)-dependent dehydrogenase (short-subunit alcohol dehydrogenase family)